MTDGRNYLNRNGGVLFLRDGFVGSNFEVFAEDIPRG